MVQLAIKHEYLARRLCCMLALDMFAMPRRRRRCSASRDRSAPAQPERRCARGLLGVFPKASRDRQALPRALQARALGRGGCARGVADGTPIIRARSPRAVHPVVGKADWLGRPFGLPYFPLTPTFPWLGPLGLLPLPTKWSIDFGEPIDLAEHGPEGAEDPILVNRIAESVRETIQRMVDGRLARRRSIWFG
jgi:hypothetical protein